MTSAYLNRPLRSYAQALADRSQVMLCNDRTRKQRKMTLGEYFEANEVPADRRAGMLALITSGCDVYVGDYVRLEPR